MIDVNELRKGVTFTMDGEIYKVLEYQHHKPGRGKATIRTTLRNLRTGTTLQHNFISGDRVQVGAPFFNRLAVPLSYLLLLVMGFGPVTPWRTARDGLVWRRTRGPAMLGLASGVLIALTVTRAEAGSA